MVAKGSLDIIGFTNEISVDNAVAIAGYKTAVARDAGEACHVIYSGAIWRFHDELIGRNLMSTGAACTA